MKKETKQVIFYLATASIGTVIDLGLFFLLEQVGMAIILAQWIAALVGNTQNFLWQFFAVFDHNQKLSRSYIYTISLAIGLILISGPLLVGLNLFLDNVTIAKLILYPIIGTVGYLARKYLIFIKT